MSTRGGPKTTTFQETLTRQWSIVLALQGAAYGLTVPELARRTEIPRSTLYRYLDFLERAGIPLATETVNGEARRRLLRTSELPPLGLSSLQIAALHLARTELDHLAGSSLVREIDTLLARLRPPEQQIAFTFARNAGARTGVLAAIERALEKKRRLRLSYRSRASGGKAQVVHVDPAVLRVAERVPYVRGFCLERGAARTYRLSRIQSAEVTSDPATHAAEALDESTFEHSRKVWSGDATLVKVRLDASVAHLAADYPLMPEQREQLQRDGSLLIEAKLAGFLEALPWILGWGPAAEVFAPPELRALVTEQLTQTLGRYARPPVAKAAAKKMGPTKTSRPTRVRQGRRRVGA